MLYRFREKHLRVTRYESGELRYYLVEDSARGVQHRLYEMEYQVASLLDGTRTAEKVAKLVSRRHKVALQAVDVEKFVAQLRALGFIEDV